MLLAHSILTLGCASLEVLMKWNSILGHGIVLLSLVSCGNDIIESKSAPRNKNQVGIIASCTTVAEAKEIAASYGGKYRIINEKRKLIEFIGISKKELIQLKSATRLKENKLYEDVLISGSFDSKSIGNYPFYGPHTPQYRNTNSFRYFPHLEQVNISETELGEGSVIAIIDTGVYYNHPHLSPNIKTSNDKHGDDADYNDTDGNGFVDDYVGWDFYNGDAYPIDDNGHGTHVAGLAASTYMGIAPKAKILPVKVLSESGRGDLATIAAGILYAIDNGADIINLSLGGSVGQEITAEVQAIIDAANYGNSQGSLLVAAAGNGGADGIGDCNDNSPVYPANIQSENVISVGSVDSYNDLTDYSNFGGATVHIAAPGGDSFSGGLYSTAIPSCFGPCSLDDIPYEAQMGTSMATPIVAGAAAVLKSFNKTLQPGAIKNQLMKNVTKQDHLNGLITSSGTLNLKEAIKNN